MMLTATISVTAVSEPDPVEYVDIDCQPSAVSVDCNNVQSTPLKLNALLRIGAESKPVDVFWQLHVHSSGNELGSAASPGASSEYEYYLPADKWGNADSILVEAYNDSSYKELLSQKRVAIVRQNPSPYPIDGDWRPLPFKYKNGEYFLEKDMGLIFMWMNPVPGNSEIHPSEDVKLNPDKTSWKATQEYPLIGTRLLLARKIDADLIDVENLKVKHLDGADGVFSGTVKANAVYTPMKDVRNESFVIDPSVHGTSFIGTSHDGLSFYPLTLPELSKWFGINITGITRLISRNDGNLVFKSQGSERIIKTFSEKYIYVMIKEGYVVNIIATSSGWIVNNASACLFSNDLKNWV